MTDAKPALDTVPAPPLRPSWLWAGILAGPVAWGLDLVASYAAVHWVCRTNIYRVLPAIMAFCLLVVIAGGLASWTALSQVTGDRTPPMPVAVHERVRFMAVLGLASSALFSLQILAAALPTGVLDACH